MPVYNYDLKSSFPMVASNLLDIRECNWIQADHYIDEAVYGYAKCRVTINDDVVVSPIMAEEGRSLISPTGSWNDVLSKGELDFIAKWKIGSYVVEDGWWAVKKNKWRLNKPLEIPVKRALEYKEQGGLKGMLAKRMSVGNFYGKFGEEWEDTFGPHFSPCWFAEISITVRLQVAEFIYRHNLQDNLIAVGIDGVLSDKEVRLGNNGDDAQWRLVSISPALVVSSGLVFLGLRKPKGLNLDDALAMIKEHPKRVYYGKQVMRRVTLKDALARDFSELGKERPMSSSIDLLRGKHDRVFPKLPKTGGQLISKVYKSKPKGVML